MVGRTEALAAFAQPAPTILDASDAMPVVIRRAFGTDAFSPDRRVVKHQRDESRDRNQQPNRGESPFEQHEPRDDQNGDAECDASATDTLVGLREAGDLSFANRQPTGIIHLLQP